MNKIIKGGQFLDIDLILDKAGVKENTKIADLGCGSGGYFVFPSAQRVGVHGVVYAIDILKSILESIRRRAKQDVLDEIVKIIWSDLEIYGATKIDASSVDVALLANTLYQSHKRVEILREATRLLKKGGRLVVVEWKNTSCPFGPPADAKVDKKHLEDAASRLGLHEEGEFQAGEYHYGKVFIK